jgi:hypothetical protein
MTPSRPRFCAAILRAFSRCACTFTDDDYGLTAGTNWIEAHTFESIAPMGLIVDVDQMGLLVDDAPKSLTERKSAMGKK